MNERVLELISRTNENEKCYFFVGFGKCPLKASFVHLEKTITKNNNQPVVGSWKA